MWFHVDSFRLDHQHDLKCVEYWSISQHFLTFHRHLLASPELLHRFLTLLIRCDPADFNNHVAFNKTSFLILCLASLKAPLVPGPIICNPHVTSCYCLFDVSKMQCNFTETETIYLDVIWSLIFFLRPSLCVFSHLGLKLIIECNARHRLELYSYTSTEGPRH